MSPFSEQSRDGMRGGAENFGNGCGEYRCVSRIEFVTASVYYMTGTVC